MPIAAPISMSHVGTDLGLTIVKYGKIGSADSFQDGFKHGPVRHVGIGVNGSDPIRPEHNLQVMAEVRSHGGCESVADKDAQPSRASNPLAGRHNNRRLAAVHLTQVGDPKLVAREPSAISV
jgi:hypothetical protein